MVKSARSKVYGEGVTGNGLRVTGKISRIPYPVSRIPKCNLQFSKRGIPVRHKQGKGIY